MLSKLSPSYVYFMSGVCASAGVNLLTALPSMDVSLVRMPLYLLSAGLWVVAAWICAHWGMVVEACHLDAASLSDKTLSRQEVRALVAVAVGRRRGKVIAAALGGVLVAIIALGLGALSRRDAFGLLPQPTISPETPATAAPAPAKW